MGITIRQISDPLIVLERVVARLSVLLDDDQWREVDKVKKKIHAEFMMAEVGKMVGSFLVRALSKQRRVPMSWW